MKNAPTPPPSGRSADAMPLMGVKVLAIGSLISGHYASAMLAQFGAEVMTIEPPNEGYPPRTCRKRHDGTSLWWYVPSRNKKSVTLDLKRAEARDIARSLAAEANIVVENFRPGMLEKWRPGWEPLSALNPTLVMVFIFGYVQSGPYSARPGFAAIAECVGGLRQVTGFADRPHVRVGVSLRDTLASLYGTIGALVTMEHPRANGGKGQFIDVALYESVFPAMEGLTPEYAEFCFVRERSGAILPGPSPSITYRCGDGRYLVITGIGDVIFKRLMNAIGRDDLGRTLSCRAMKAASKPTSGRKLPNRNGRGGACSTMS